MTDNKTDENEEFGDFVTEQSDVTLHKGILDNDDDFEDFKEFSNDKANEDQDDKKKLPVQDDIKFEKNYDILNDIKIDSFIHKNSDKTTPTELAAAEVESRRGGGGATKELIDLLSNYEQQGDLSRIGQVGDEAYREIASQSFLDTMSPLPKDKSGTKENNFQMRVLKEEENSQVIEEENNGDEDLFDDFIEDQGHKDDGAEGGHDGQNSKDASKENCQDMNLVDISAISRGDNRSRLGQTKRNKLGESSLMGIMEMDVSMHNLVDLSAPGPLDKETEARVMEESLVKPSDTIAEVQEFSEEHEDARIDEYSTSNILKGDLLESQVLDGNSSSIQKTENILQNYENTKGNKLSENTIMNIMDMDISMPNVIDISAPGPLDKDTEARVLYESLLKPSKTIGEVEEFSEEQENARIEEPSSGNILKDSRLMDSRLQDSHILDIDTSAIEKYDNMLQVGQGNKSRGISDSFMNIVDMDISMPNVIDISAPGPFDAETEARVLDQSLVQPSKTIAELEEFSEEQENARIEENSTSNILRDSDLLQSHLVDMNIPESILNNEVLNFSHELTPRSNVHNEHLNNLSFNSPMILTSKHGSTDVFMNPDGLAIPRGSYRKKQSKGDRDSISIDVNQISLEKNQTRNEVNERVDEQVPQVNAGDDDLFDDFKEETDIVAPSDLTRSDSPIFRETSSKKKKASLFNLDEQTKQVEDSPPTKAASISKNVPFNPPSDYTQTPLPTPDDRLHRHTGPPHDPTHRIEPHKIPVSKVDSSHKHGNEETHKPGHSIIINHIDQSGNHKTHENQPDYSHPQQIDQIDEDDLFGDEIINDREPLQGGVDEEDDVEAGKDPNAPHHLPLKIEEAEEKSSAIKIEAGEINIEAGDKLTAQKVILEHLKKDKTTSPNDSKSTPQFTLEEFRGNQDDSYNYSVKKNDQKDKTDILERYEPVHISKQSDDDKQASKPEATDVPKDDDDDLFEEFEENEEVNPTEQLELQINRKVEVENTSDAKIDHQDHEKDQDDEDLFGDEDDFQEAEIKSKESEQKTDSIQKPQEPATIAQRPHLLFDANQFEVMREHLNSLAPKRDDSKIKKPRSTKKKTKEIESIQNCKVMEGQLILVDEHYEALTKITENIANPGYLLTGEDKLNYSLHRKLMLSYWQSSVFNQQEYLNDIDQSAAVLKDFGIGDVSQANQRIVSEKWKRMSQDYLDSLPDYSSLFAH